VRTTVREFEFEEVVTNILRDDREHDITVSIDFSDSAIVMQFEDDGVPSAIPRNIGLPHSPTRSSTYRLAAGD
jgi:hypothetical protein